MVSKRVVSNQPPPIADEPDEGWWASVLADEEAIQPMRQDLGMRVSGLPSMSAVDWDHVQELFEKDELIIMHVHGCNRGGLLVQCDDFQGFVPISHLVDMPANLGEEERHERLNGYVGGELTLKVIECEPSQERIVLSERAAQAGEGRRKQLFRILKSGERISGMVTNVTDFGVFVDLGGVEGLIHVSELSWGRVQHPTDVLKVGQNVETLVLQVNEESSRVALSLKRLTENPWDTLVERHKPGDVISATVTSIMRFGAFARLDEGIEGLIHISSIERRPDQKSIETVLSPGQRVEVRILHIDASRRRLGLGLVNIE